MINNDKARFVTNIEERLGDINEIEVKVNDNPLPFKIGEKIEFPVDNPILKTICAIQINEDGQENYLLQWFEDGSFKQYWISLTELKILRENYKRRNAISL